MLSLLAAILTHVLRRTCTSTNSTRLCQFFPIPRWQIIMIIATESSPTSPILTIHERSSWVCPKFQNLGWLTIILDDMFLFPKFSNISWFQVWFGTAAPFANRIQSLVTGRRCGVGSAATATVGWTRRGRRDSDDGGTWEMGRVSPQLWLVGAQMQWTNWIFSDISFSGWIYIIWSYMIYLAITLWGYLTFNYSFI